MSKKLNGIPNNLVESFFSTLKYYEVGYMTDWMVNVMKKHNIREASLDVLKVKADPKQLSIRPILVNLESIQYIIKSELEVNGFATDYITEAIIKVSYDPTLPERTFYPEEWKPERAFYAHAVVTDKEGNKYEMPKKAYNSYEDFDGDFATLKNKKQKLKECEVLKKDVSKIVNKIDPDNLISSGAPEDEYSGVVDHIVSLLVNKNFTEENLAIACKGYSEDAVSKIYKEIKSKYIEKSKRSLIKKIIYGIYVFNMLSWISTAFYFSNTIYGLCNTTDTDACMGLFATLLLYSYPLLVIVISWVAEKKKDLRWHLLCLPSATLFLFLGVIELPLIIMIIWDMFTYIPPK